MQKLSDNITSILDVMVPIRVFQNRKHYAPWLSPSTKNWMKLRDQAYDKALETMEMDDFGVYKKLRNKVSNILKTEKQVWLFNKIREASENTGKSWKIIKSTLGWSSGGPPNQLSVGGRLIYKPREIAQEMNSYFVSKIKTIAANLPPSQVDASAFTAKIMRYRNCKFSLHAVHPDGVDKVISKLKNSKTCGMDTIDTYVLKLARLN